MKVIQLKRSPKLVTALRIMWGNIRKKDRSLPELDKVKFLRKIPFFEHLRKHQLELVAQIVHEREYNENEFLFEKGQPGAALFIVQGGEISVEIPTEDEIMQITVLSKGSFVGELALLDETPRSASARALGPSKCLALFRADLEKLNKIDSDITTQIYRSLAAIIGQRLKATNELLERKAEAA